jgi:serine/threonine-protein kinase
MVVNDDVVQRVQARVGTTIADKWRLTRVLGIGGMAAVYAAVHRNQSRVAIKMLHPEQSVNETVRSRFLREGYVANTVDHRGAVRVFDDGIVDGSAFLVMELLEGETLEDRRARMGGRLPSAEALTMAEQLLQTLAAAHEKGIVHRDIKPDNLFLTSDGQLKVLDFGIARLRELSDPNSTSAGTFMGTPSFMPPEQARGRWSEVDARSDVWATGATLFYLLSGEFVHNGETFADQLALAVREPAAPLQKIEPGVPDAVASVVDKALAYRPTERYEDALSMLGAVRAALRAIGPPITSSVRAEGDGVRPPSDETRTLMATPDPVSPAPKRTSAGVVAITPAGGAPRHRSRWVAALALVVAVVAILALWLRNRSSEPYAEPSHVSIDALRGDRAVPPQALAASHTAPAPAARVEPEIPAVAPPPTASATTHVAATPVRKPVSGTANANKLTPRREPVPVAAQIETSAASPPAPAAPKPAVSTDASRLLDKRF